MLNQDGFILLTRTQPIRYALERAEQNGTTSGEAYLSRANYTYRTGWNEHIALTKRTYTMSDLLNVFSTAGLWIETAIEPQLTEQAARRYPHKQAWMNKYLGIPMSGEAFRPGSVFLAAADGSVRRVADDIAFPNGMAVTADNSTLIVADSYRHSLVAFDIDADGGLSNRRVWAELGDGVPDGICVDVQDAIWYADVPNRWAAPPWRRRPGPPSVRDVTDDPAARSFHVAFTDPGLCRRAAGQGQPRTARVTVVTSADDTCPPTSG